MIEFDFSGIIENHLLTTLVIILLFVAPALVLVIIGYIFRLSKTARQWLLYLGFLIGAFLLWKFGIPGLLNEL